MLKCMKPASDEHHAAAVLDYFGGNGAVRIYRASEHAWLMERGARPRELTRMVLAGDDDGAAEILAVTIAKLHAARPRPPPGDLPSLRRRFAALLDNADRPDEPDVLRRCAAMATALISPRRQGSHSRQGAASSTTGTIRDSHSHNRTRPPSHAPAGLTQKSKARARLIASPPSQTSLSLSQPVTQYIELI